MTSGTVRRCRPASCGPGEELLRPARHDDTDRIEAVVVGPGEDEIRRIRVAEPRALPPLDGAQQIAETRTPVAVEDDALDVVARGRGQRRAPLQQVGAEAVHGQAGGAQPGERALAALLAGEPPPP